MRFTRHKSTQNQEGNRLLIIGSWQNLVGFPVYFQTFLLFVQRSNYHWSCFRLMRKKLHHKFKNKYIMPQIIIECWRKCKNPYWIWCMHKCSFFFPRMYLLCVLYFLSKRRGTNIYFFLKNIFVTINQLKKWHFMWLSLAYPRDRALGNPGKYLWEYKWINWVPCPRGV